MPVPTIFDVARRAGVSKSTVSKVLTRAPHVSQAARERVEAAIADLNYHPNVAARRFQSRRSQLIGLAFPPMGEPTQLPPFFSALMSGVMLKTALYGLLRVTFDLLSVQLWWWGALLLALGLLSALYGARR